MPLLIPRPFGGSPFPGGKATTGQQSDRQSATAAQQLAAAFSGSPNQQAGNKGNPSGSDNCYSSQGRNTSGSISSHSQDKVSPQHYPHLCTSHLHYSNPPGTLSSETSAALGQAMRNAAPPGSGPSWPSPRAAATAAAEDIDTIYGTPSGGNTVWHHIAHGPHTLSEPSAPPLPVGLYPFHLLNDPTVQNAARAPPVGAPAPFDGRHTDPRFSLTADGPARHSAEGVVSSLMTSAAGAPSKETSRFLLSAEGVLGGLIRFPSALLSSGRKSSEKPACIPHDDWTSGDGGRGGGGGVHYVKADAVRGWLEDGRAIMMRMRVRVHRPVGRSLLRVCSSSCRVIAAPAFRDYLPSHVDECALNIRQLQGTSYVYMFCRCAFT